MIGTLRLTVLDRSNSIHEERQIRHSKCIQENVAVETVYKGLKYLKDEIGRVLDTKEKC
jgi:hypothetical protein